MFSPFYFGSRYFGADYWPPAKISGPQVLIGGVDRTGLLQQLSWSDRLEARSTLNFKLRALGPTPYYRPAVGERVEFSNFNASGNILKFVGSIDSFKEKEPLGIVDQVNFYDVKCVSLDAVLDRFHANKRYTGPQPAGEIVRDLIANFVPDAENITVNGVDDGLDVQTIVFGRKRISDCLRDLADLIGFEWYVDVFGDLKFFNRLTFTAPFSVEKGGGLYRNANVSRDRSRLRNVQYIRAGQDRTDEQVENFAGDDELTSFNTTYPIAEIVKIELNADVQRTAAVKLNLYDLGYRIPRLA